MEGKTSFRVVGLSFRVAFRYHDDASACLYYMAALDSQSQNEL